MKFCDILLFKNMSEQEITQMNKSKFMKKRIYAKNQERNTTIKNKKILNTNRVFLRKI